MENKNEYKEITKQFVEVPTNDIKLGLGEGLVYACIAKFKNKHSNIAFPSIKTICKLSGYTNKTVKKHIDALIAKRYLSRRFDGKKNIYYFNPYKHFECFSYDFLDNPELNSSEKAMYIAEQQYILIHDKDRFTVNALPITEVTEKLGVSRPTYYNYLNSMVEKGMITIHEDMNNLREYNQDEINNALVYEIRNLKEGFDNHEKRLSEIEKLLGGMYKELSRLKAENAMLKKENKPSEFDGPIIL